jgi:hypothetical protein
MVNETETRTTRIRTGALKGPAGPMPGNEEMQLPERSPRLEWNLNTILNLVLSVMVVGGVYYGPISPEISKTS